MHHCKARHRANDTEGLLAHLCVEEYDGKRFSAMQLFSSPGSNYIISVCGNHGLSPANTSGDDVDRYSDNSRGTMPERFFLRQEVDLEGRELC